MYSATVRRNDPCPARITRRRRSSLIERTKRSACAFRFSDIGGRRIALVPGPEPIAELLRVFGISIDDRAHAGRTVTSPAGAGPPVLARDGRGALSCRRRQTGWRAGRCPRRLYARRSGDCPFVNRRDRTGVTLPGEYLAAFESDRHASFRFHEQQIVAPLTQCVARRRATVTHIDRRYRGLIDDGFLRIENYVAGRCNRDASGHGEGRAGQRNYWNTQLGHGFALDWIR